MWLIEGMDLSTDPFEERGYDITWDAQETKELMRGLITRMMARKTEEENKGRVAMLVKNYQELAFHEFEGEDKDPKDTKTLQVTML